MNLSGFIQIARLRSQSFRILNLAGFIQIGRLRSQKSFRKLCSTWQDSSSGPGCEIQWGPRKDCRVGDPVRKSKRLSDGRSRFTKSILLRWKLLLSGDQTCSSSSVEVGMPHCFAARKLLCSIDAWRKKWNQSWEKCSTAWRPRNCCDLGYIKPRGKLPTVSLPSGMITRVCKGDVYCSEPCNRLRSVDRPLYL